jgi:hypothetical protein
MTGVVPRTPAPLALPPEKSESTAVGEPEVPLMDPEVPVGGVGFGPVGGRVTWVPGEVVVGVVEGLVPSAAVPALGGLLVWVTSPTATRSAAATPLTAAKVRLRRR